MFSKDITGSDAFRDMSSGAQALYFHLGMEADDDGFLGGFRATMRGIGCSLDDFKSLVGKNFVILFSSGVLVIKHHRMNNNWDKYNCKRTVHQEEFSQLYIKENKAYTLDKLQGIALQSDSRLFPVFRIEENRREEKRIKKLPAAPAAPFSLNTQIEKMEANSRRDLNIIAFYFRERKSKFNDMAQLQVGIRRHLRAAKQLIPFTDDQISKAARKAATDYPEWTLETVTKILTK